LLPPFVWHRHPHHVEVPAVRDVDVVLPRWCVVVIEQPCQVQLDADSIALLLRLRPRGPNLVLGLLEGSELAHGGCWWFGEGRTKLAIVVACGLARTWALKGRGRDHH
jgi:hypothetical protein